jgi:hypothetical protein
MDLGEMNAMMSGNSRSAKSGAKSLLTNLLLFGAAAVLALGLVELCFRVFFPHPGYRHSEHDTLFEYHEMFGWEFIPDKKGIMALPYENEIEVRINSLGMRDRPRVREKSSGKRRIVVLGDSFTSGLGVWACEGFTAVMEKILSKRWEVLNFGVDGYGPAQEFLLLRDKAIQFHPDLILLVIYIGNDLDDIMGTHDWINSYSRPMATLGNNGRLEWRNIPVPAPKPNPAESGITRYLVDILGNSHFFNFCGKQLKDRYRASLSPPELRFCKKSLSPESEAAFRLMERLIYEFSSFAREKGTKLAIVIAPTLVQVYPGYYWKRIKAAYGVAETDYDLLLPNSRIKEACEKARVPVLDLAPTFRRAAVPGRGLYYLLNAHWTARGHDLVARSVVNFLRAKGLVEIDGINIRGGDMENR